MPAKEITANLFTVWFNHHTRPEGAHYAYYVFPAASATTIDSRALSLHLVENSDKTQVVEDIKKQIAGFVFVQPGEVTTKTFSKVTVDQPCVIMISKKKVTWEIAVTDPTHLQSKIVIGLPGNKKSKTYNFGYDKKKNITFLTITLPQGEEAGKTVKCIVE